MTAPTDDLDVLIVRLQSGRLSAREWEYLRTPCADALTALRAENERLRSLPVSAEVEAMLEWLDSGACIYTNWQHDVSKTIRAQARQISEGEMLIKAAQNERNRQSAATERAEAERDAAFALLNSVAADTREIILALIGDAARAGK